MHFTANNHLTSNDPPTAYRTLETIRVHIRNATSVIHEVG